MLSKFQLAPQSVTLEVTLLCAVLPSTIPSVLRFCLRSPLRTHLTEALRQGCVLSTWSPNIRHEQLRQNDVKSVSSSCTQLEESTPSRSNHLEARRPSSRYLRLLGRHRPQVHEAPVNEVLTARTPEHSHQHRTLSIQSLHAQNRCVTASLVHARR